jgi:hypothetical protein
MIFGEYKLEQNDIDNMMQCIKTNNYARQYDNYDYDDITMLLKYIINNNIKDTINSIINNIIDHMDNYSQYIRDNRLYDNRQKTDNSKYNDYLIFELYEYLSDTKLLDLLCIKMVYWDVGKNLKYTKHILNIMEKRPYIKEHIEIIVNCVPNIKYRAPYHYEINYKFMFDGLTCYGSPRITMSDFVELVSIKSQNLKFLEL